MEFRIVPLDDIRISKRFRKGFGSVLTDAEAADISELSHSIEQVGLLHPIVLSPDLFLIAGRRRLLAYARMCRTHIEAAIIDANSLKERKMAEFAENELRLELAPGDRTAAIKYLQKEVKKKAKQRQKAGQKKGGRTGGRGRSKKKKTTKKPKKGGKKRGRKPKGYVTLDHQEDDSSTVNYGKANTRHERTTSDILARHVGWSGRTLEKAEAVEAKAKEDSARFGHLVAQMNETGKVDPAYKEMRRLCEEKKPEGTAPKESNHLKTAKKAYLKMNDEDRDRFSDWINAGEYD